MNISSEQLTFFLLMIIILCIVLRWLISRQIPLPPLPKTTVSGQTVNAETGAALGAVSVNLLDGDGNTVLDINGNPVIPVSDDAGNFQGEVSVSAVKINSVVFNGTVIAVNEVNINITAGQDNNIGVVGVSKISS